MRKLGVSIMFFLCVASMGCASAGPIATWEARSRLQDLELGMSKAEILRIMGRPYSREIFIEDDGKPVEFLLYQTKFVGVAVAPGDNELVPVAVKDGVVVGWGRNFYDRTKRYQVQQDISIRDRQ